MEKVNLDRNKTLPQWNYTLKPYPSEKKRDWEELLLDKLFFREPLIQSN